MGGAHAFSQCRRAPRRLVTPILHFAELAADGHASAERLYRPAATSSFLARDFDIAAMSKYRRGRDDAASSSITMLKMAALRFHRANDAPVKNAIKAQGYFSPIPRFCLFYLFSFGIESPRISRLRLRAATLFCREPWGERSRHLGQHASASTMVLSPQK